MPTTGSREKRPLTRLFVATIAMALLAACGTPAKDVTLSQAIDEGLVTVTFTNRATYGDIMIALVESTSDQPVNMSVERGTLLRNDRAGGESFVVYSYRGRLESPDGREFAKAATIALDGAGALQYALLEGYSLNALTDPATALDTFTLDGMVTGDTLAVIQAATDAHSIQAKQMALWATTDNVSAQDLSSISFKYVASDLDEARDLLQRAGLKPEIFKLFGS